MLVAFASIFLTVAILSIPVVAGSANINISPEKLPGLELRINDPSLTYTGGGWKSVGASVPPMSDNVSSEDIRNDPSMSNVLLIGAVVLLCLVLFLLAEIIARRR